MKQIDMARVLYGISDAKSGMDAYIEMVKNADKDIKPLLDWKLHIHKDSNKWSLRDLGIFKNCKFYNFY